MNGFQSHVDVLKRQYSNLPKLSNSQALLAADLANATALALLLPEAELQDAAKKQLAEFSRDLDLDTCPALLTLLVSKDLLPSLVSSPCMRQICDQLLKNAKNVRKGADLEFSAALAQLVLSNDLVSCQSCCSVSVKGCL